MLCGLAFVVVCLLCVMVANVSVCLFVGHCMLYELFCVFSVFVLNCMWCDLIA